MKKYVVIRKTIFLILCAALSFSAALYSVKSFYHFRLDQVLDLDDDWEKLTKSALGRYKTIGFAREQTPADSRFLVFRQPDFAYYANRQFINQFDPILIPLYKQDSKASAFRILQELDIDYIYTPDYMEPTIANSQIAQVIADPRLSKIVFQSGGYRLYEIFRKPISVRVRALKNNSHVRRGQQNSNLSVSWSAYSDKDKYREVNVERIKGQSSDIELRLTNNERRHAMLYTEEGPLFISPQKAFRDSRIHPGNTYTLNTTVKGQGMLNIYLITYSTPYSNCEKYKFIHLWNGLLHESFTHIASQFITPSDAHDFRIALMLKRQGSLVVKDFSLAEVHADDHSEPLYSKKTSHAGSNYNWDQLYRVSFDKNTFTALTGADTGGNKEESLSLSPESYSGEYSLFLNQPQREINWVNINQSRITLTKISLLKDIFNKYIMSNVNHIIRIASSTLWNDVSEKLTSVGIPNILDGLQASSIVKQAIRYIIDGLGNIYKAVAMETCSFGDEKYPDRYRGSVAVKGSGYVDVAVLWKDKLGVAAGKKLHSYNLPSEYNTIVEEFTLPSDATDITFSFRSNKLKENYSRLYLDELTLEKKGALSLDPDPAEEGYLGQ